MLAPECYIQDINLTIRMAHADVSLAWSQQLKTEVRVHRMLNHKHVVRFEHSFETEHYVYILLELCPNKVSPPQPILPLLPLLSFLTPASFGVSVHGGAAEASDAAGGV